MALVEMGVGVDEQRRHNAPGHRQARRLAQIERPGRRQRRDATVLDQDVDAGEAVAVARLRTRRVDGEDPRILQSPAARLGDGESPAHVSRFRALSCQRCSSDQESALSSR